MIKINGKEYDRETALEVLKDSATTVSQLKVSYPRKGNLGEPPTNEGFEISKDFISTMSESMNKMNAGFASLSFENSKKIENKTVILFMLNPGYVPKWKMKLFNIMKELIS